jgi:amino acid transporter
MAADKLLPSRLNRLHPRYQTPYFSILICAVVVSGMILWTFGDLIIIDVSLYSMGLLLEFLSLIVLRRKYPLELRPFRIPLQGFGLWLLLLLPMAVFGIALAGSLMAAAKTLPPLLFTAGALLSAELAWALLRVRNSAKSTARPG